MLRLERTPLRLTTTKTGTWQSLFQWPLRIVQKLYITAIFLPLVLLGAGMLIYRRQVKSLAILLVVPGYYFSTQSALHTEYRYVLVIHYFLFVLAAVGIYSIICQMNRKLTRLNLPDRLAIQSPKRTLTTVLSSAMDFSKRSRVVDELTNHLIS